MRSAVTVLMVSGSLRAGSTNTALLQTAQAVAPDGVNAVLYVGLAHLPQFNPDDDHEPIHPAVADLRTALGRADALLFSTPEYAGALPGSFKNLLDWTVGGGGTYGMPAAWLNASGVQSPTGAADAHESLRKVLGYTGVNIVEEACIRLPVARQSVGPDGLIADPAVHEQLSRVLGLIAEQVRERRRYTE